MPKRSSALACPQKQVGEATSTTDEPTTRADTEVMKYDRSKFRFGLHQFKFKVYRLVSDFDTLNQFRLLI